MVANSPRALRTDQKLRVDLDNGVPCHDRHPPINLLTRPLQEMPNRRGSRGDDAVQFGAPECEPRVSRPLASAILCIPTDLPRPRGHAFSDVRDFRTMPNATIAMVEAGRRGGSELALSFDCASPPVRAVSASRRCAGIIPGGTAHNARSSAGRSRSLDRARIR